MRLVFASAVALAGASLLSACGPASEDAARTDGADAEPTLSALVDASPRFDGDLTIEVGRIGEAAAGMSLAEIEALLPGAAIRFERDFMVDFSALCFERLAVEVLCAVIDAADEPAPSAAAVMLLTRNPDVKTAEGVHPGMSVAAASAIYGPAAAGYSLDNESREYVYFLEGPSGGLYFRAAGADGGLAGDYADVDADEGYVETARLREGALISQIEVTAID